MGTLHQFEKCKIIGGGIRVGKQDMPLWREAGGVESFVLTEAIAWLNVAARFYSHSTTEAFMSLLDGLIGAVAKEVMGGKGQQQALIEAALKMMGNQQGGGLGGLVETLTKAGLKDQVSSWVSTGKNVPVTGTQLESALGAGPLGEIAKSLGMSNQSAAGGLAAVLPQLIDHLTPDGNVPQSSMLEQGLKVLAGQLFKK